MSIVRRIKREARNNPAKAALLAGLLGLALYCWAPLLMGWLGADDKSPRDVSRSKGDTDQTDRPESKPPAAEDESDSRERPSWHELRQWQQGSPWTASVELAPARDPFRAVVVNEETVEEIAEIEEAPAATPKQVLDGLDIQLTGTIVGPQRRVALLDGQAYREGDTVLVEHLGTTWELRIRRIEARQVTLAWQSIERILTVPERQPVGRIKLVKQSR